MSPVTVPVPKQPSMDVYTDEKPPVYDGEHWHSHVELEENQQWSLRTTHTHAGHKHCHNSRLKRFLVPVVVALVAVCGLIGLYCLLGGEMADPGEIVEGLFYAKRQFDGDNGGSGSGNGTESDFTRRKLYLIVIFVGLFVVVILGIMLAAWCCKGSFQNPLCCPCYLCACCGGLACLECIGCGLCAEGVDQM